MPLKTLGSWLVGRRDLPAQAKRYAQTVIWLYRSVFHFRPYTAALAIATNVSGTLLKGASLTLLVYFASMLESDTPFTFNQIDFALQPREPSGFALMVLLIGTLLLSGGIVVFLANRINIKLAVEFALNLSQQVLTLPAGRPSRNINPIAGAYPKEIYARSRGVIVIARSIRPLLQLFQPLLLMIICLAALMYIDPFLTAVIAVLALPSLLIQYLINYTAAQNQKLLGKAQKRMQRGICDILESLSLAPRVSRSEEEALARAYSSEVIREYPNRFITRVMAQPKSQMVSDMLIAVMAMIIVLYLGISALAGQISWALVVGYIIFARVGMTSLRGLLGTITGFARHYPRARKMYELLSSKPMETRLNQDVLKITRSARNTPGDLKSIDFKRGDTLGVLSPVPFTRYNIYAWGDALGWPKGVDRNKILGAIACIPDATKSRPGGSLRELLGCDEYISTNEIQRILEGIVTAPLKSAVADIDFDSPLDEHTWNKLPPVLRSHLLLEQGIKSGKDIFLVEYQVVQKAEDEYLRLWWKRASSRFVLIRYNMQENFGHCGEKGLLAMRTDRARAVMSLEWARMNHEKLSAWIANARVIEEEDEEDPME